MGHNYRAVAFTAPNTVEVLPFTFPELEAGGLKGADVLVEMHATGISPGTEMRCLSGAEPGAPEWPFVPGYSGVGQVIDAGPDASHLVGKMVQCGGTGRMSLRTSWGGHSSHVLHTADGVNVLPDGVKDVDGALGRMVGIAHRGFLLANPQPGQTVAIVGLGLIGQLSARWFATSEARVLALDLSEERCAVAAKSGVDTRVPSAGLPEAVNEHYGHGADIVVDATGSVRVLEHSIAATKDVPWGEWSGHPKLVLQGSYALNVEFDYHLAFRKELELLMPRDTARSDIVAGLDALGTGLLNVDVVVKREVSPDEAAEAYRILREQPNDAITFVIRWK